MGSEDIIGAMKKILVALSLLLPVLLSGCGNQKPSLNSSVPAGQSASSVPSVNASEVSSEEESGGGEALVPVSSVSLDKTSMEIYTDDADASLTATVLPENATNKNVVWSSSDTSVATVNDGRITPLKAGNALIMVKTEDGDKKAACSLMVKESVRIPNYVMHGLYQGESDWTDKQMILNPSTASEYMIQGVQLHEGDLFKIHMYGDTWYGYSAVKTSTPSGLVAAGPTDDNIKVLITGVYDIYSNYDVADNGHIYLCRVDGGDPNPDPVSVTGISLSRTGKFMEVRNEFQLEATVYPSNAANKEVRWTSSDTDIATVTRAGRVIAKEKRGSTTITAKTADGSKTATCLVYVSPSGIPDYYLTGTISGYSRGYGNYNFAGIPLSTGKYLIPDVELVVGDEITITGSNGAKLKNKYNQTYTYKVDKNMSVNVYLDVNEANKNYLSFENK